MVSTIFNGSDAEDAGDLVVGIVVELVRTLGSHGLDVVRQPVKSPFIPSKGSAHVAGGRELSSDGGKVQVVLDIHGETFSLLTLATGMPAGAFSPGCGI